MTVAVRPVHEVGATPQRRGAAAGCRDAGRGVEDVSEDWPGTRPVSGGLATILTLLRQRGDPVVTSGVLSGYAGPGQAASVAKALRAAGWLVPMRARGAWLLACVAPCQPAGFDELVARLAVAPQTPACIAGRSVPRVRGWLHVPATPTISYPPGGKLPRCLDGFNVCRWQARSPLDTIHGVPVWTANTLIVYMAARAGRFPWADIALWLEECCADVALAPLVVELHGQPRSVWHKVAYLLASGDREDLSAALVDLAPDGAGPYRLGRPRPWHRQPPQWSAKYEVVDYAVSEHWCPKLGASGTD